MPLLIECRDYDLYTEVFKNSILVEMYDGGVARIQHRRVEVTFKHKRTGDKVVIRITKKGHYYWTNDGIKDQRMTEDEAKAEFVRLVGNKDNGIIAFKVALCRMFVAP